MSQHPIGQHYQAQGLLVSAKTEYTLVNWAGAALPTPVDSLDEVQEIRDSAIVAGDKLGLSSELQSVVGELTIRQRDVLSIATPWGPAHV